MSDEVQARGEMREMMQVFDSLAWKLTRQMDPSFSRDRERVACQGTKFR